MKKNILIIFLMIVFLLSSCSTEETDPFLEWKLSEDAFDYNGDQKINETDYNYYVVINDYDNWLLSENAEDLNEDRSIDVTDYEIYLLESNFLYWKLSDYASDFNKDSVIDESDYYIYLNGSEFEGTYKIKDYEFFTYSEKDIYIYGNEQNIYLKDLGMYLEDIQFIVDSQGLVSIVMPEITQNLLGDSYDIILDALEGMTITRLSNFVASLDISLLLEGQEVVYSIYLNQTDNGFRVEYSFIISEAEIKILFDLVKVN